jgi:Na+-translocating ferredoxin:NAD+ oxidoreductase RNF subunit RnfB
LVDEGNPMTLVEQRETLAKYLEGTCMSIETAIEHLELDPSIDWEDEMLTASMELCLGCGWWMESSELVHEDEEDTGYCDDCKDE